MKIVVCADVHLSDNPPRCRSQEKNWLETQMAVLEQVNAIANKRQAEVLVCGDFFHKPIVSPKLEIAAIQTISTCSPVRWRALPGQHDMPGHNLNSLDDSSFGVLAEAGCFFHDDLFCLVPYGQDLLRELCSTKAPVAFAHSMLWMVEPFPGAPKHGNVDTLDSALHQKSKCKLLFSGDNHTPFEYEGKNITIINCGSLLRRTVDQKDHKPSVVLVDTETLGWERIYLNTSKDVFIVPENLQSKTRDEKQAEMQAFMLSLGSVNVDKELSLDHVLSVVYESMGTANHVKQLIQEVRNDNGDRS